MNYYGVKREIYKGNKSMPEETIIYPNLYKTEEEATKGCGLQRTSLWSSSSR